MSNQQWPPPQANGARPLPPGQSPWSHPDARWSPQSYSDAQGRDPRLPFGQPSPQDARPDIDQFEPPRRTNRNTLLWGGAILAAIVALVLVLQLTGGFASDPEAIASASPAAGQDQGPEPAATGGTSIPFEGHGTGVFEILSQTWSPDGLAVEYQITLDPGQGERSFSLYIYTNSTLESFEPEPYEFVTATSDVPYSGTAFFPASQGDSTLVLASGFGVALTALSISG